MIWDILLSATIETGLGLLTEVGFGDAAKDLHNRLFNTDEKKRVSALEVAFENALQSAADAEITPLLAQRAFQEEVVSALLNPLEGLNMQALAGNWGEKFPEHILPLRRFFNTLQNLLLANSIWGPVLERYQALRFQQEVRQALQARQLPVAEDSLVRAVSQASETYRASLRGGGSIVQGNGKAVGEQGILVEGNVEKIVQITIHQFVTRSNPAANNDERQKYLEWTASQANLLPWTKFTSKSASPEQGENLHLADVYIDLDTTEMRHMEREEELRQFLLRQHEAERISAQEMVNRKSKLLMMGDPGSGKSTFVKHLTYLMARAGLAEDAAPILERLGEWKHGTLLPVRIELRQVVAQMGVNKPNGARLILNYLLTELKGWGLEPYWDELNDAIQRKKGGLLFLLDGLDEVPTAQRQMVVDAVNDLSNLYPKHHYVVTCRPYAYVGQAWKLNGFHEVTLAPFNKEQIDRFIENWYARLAELERIERPIASEKARRLQDAVKRRDLLGLAERPLLLMVMAQLHAFAGPLPEDRTQLYADAVQLLLQRWESRLGEENGILEYLALPGLKMSDLESGLYEVAFKAHHASHPDEGTADISDGDLRSWLERYLNHDWNKAGQFIEYIRERAGLLIRHKTEAYTFPHRSFQEFLAACYWLGMEDYPGEAVKLVTEDWDRWREVFVLAAGYAARTKRLGQAIAAVNALLPQPCPGDPTLIAENLSASVLAGQALIEIGLVGARHEKAGLAVLERTQSWLLAAMQADQTITPVKRAEAGRVLGKLGDPRPEVLDSLQMAFCPIPAGEFLFGEGKEQKTMDLPAYEIGKYPVTNAQFGQFVAADGYTDTKYWEEAIKAGCWSKAGFKGHFDDAVRAAPVDFGEPYTLSNHPVVGVSWYEATAYCVWLSEQLNRSVTLPSEEQWEKAARGSDGRACPWDGKFDANKANTRETGIGSTSAVGTFPGGKSPYGILDASGNVWEWAHGENNMRGGSFLISQGLARCAYRYWYSPDDRYRFSGFRVVVSLSLLSPL